MASIFDQMINHDTGEIDPVIVAEAAKVYAAREWGGPDFPPRYLREAEQWCNERADSMRRAWRSQHGLKAWEDHELVQMQVPDWGASGDSFGRR